MKDPMKEQCVPEQWHHVEKTHDRAVREELQPMERTNVEQFMKDYIPWEGVYAGAGKECDK